MQTNMWARYHVEDPAASTRATTTGTSPVTRARPAPARAPAHRRGTADVVAPATPGSTRTTCSPSCPGADEPEFILLRPFVPTSQAGRQPAPHRVHGRQERRRRLREAAGVRDAARQPARRARRSCRARSRATRRCPSRRRCCPASGSTVSLRQPHRHPDRRRAGLRAALLRDLRADRGPGPRAGDRLLRGRGGDRGTLQEALASIFGEAPPTLEEPQGEPGEEPTPTAKATSRSRWPSCSPRPTTSSPRPTRPWPTTTSAPTSDKTDEARAKVDQAEALIEEASGTGGTEGTTTTTTDGASA